ncbi:MAG: NADH-quinone oxidoreductase subunit NuoK [Anaerolineaceae bacterium]|jgi:NADH-quinone oxidoreductase subunit K|nr:MAG: NADH-quinone oxidoreductase subunit NuoK [Chloroflexi bacterium HGW-Chloroflexi-8]
MIPLSWYLILAAILFLLGLYGAMVRKNSIAILMGVELMLNAVNINILAFWHYHSQVNGAIEINGMVFAAIVVIAAAAEAAVALAIIISVFRNNKSIVAADMNTLKG